VCGREEALEAERARSSVPDKKAAAAPNVPSLMSMCATTAMRCLSVLRLCSLHDSLGSALVARALEAWSKGRGPAGPGSAVGAGAGAGAGAGGGSGSGAGGGSVGPGVLASALATLRALFARCIDALMWRDACVVLSLTQAVNRVR
jgi:hypothetical protein